MREYDWGPRAALQRRGVGPRAIHHIVWRQAAAIGVCFGSAGEGLLEVPANGSEIEIDCILKFGRKLRAPLGIPPFLFLHLSTLILICMTLPYLSRSSQIDSRTVLQGNSC